MGRNRGRKKSWKELSRGQRTGVVVLGALQLALHGAAAWDIARRPRQQIRGSKALWQLACFLNFFGPIAYFLFGRRK